MIAPLLPSKPRGVPRVNDRRVLSGIFWALRSGAPWRDLPERYGPHTTCYNRFVRWRNTGVWDCLVNAVLDSHDGNVQMIATSIVRVHQQGATVIKGITIIVSVVPEAGCHKNQCSCRSARQAYKADAHGRPEERHRLADKGYDANVLRIVIAERKARAHIQPKANRKDSICFSPFLNKVHNLVECFFNKAKQFGRIATRYDKLAEGYLTTIKLISIRIWLRCNESTAQSEGPVQGMDISRRLIDQQGSMSCRH